MAQNDSSNQQPSPAGAALGAAWAAYALHAMGAIGFFIGPVIGLVLNYVRADDAGLTGSHHRWLIRTFWWALLGYALCLALIVVGVWPLASDVLREAIQRGDSIQIPAINISWDSILTTVGAAIVGGLGLFCVWVWFLYRLIRGALRLGDAQPAM